MSAHAIDVYWRECGQVDLPTHDRWLAEKELHVLRTFRVPKRRDDWRLGRWTAKQAVAAYLRMAVDGPSLSNIEVCPAGSGAPEVLLPLGAVRVSISITHSNGIAACAVTEPGAAIGCDLEAIAPRSDAFVADYFAESEQALIARFPAADRPWLVTLLWSAKESALKALREGLRLDTRSVEVRFDPAAAGGEWRPLTVVAEGGRTFAGWSHRDRDFVRTLVACPAPHRPLQDFPPAR